MPRLCAALFAFGLASVAHAAPEACPPPKASIQVKFTEVLLPVGVPATFTPARDPQTGAPNDLLTLQQAAARAKVTLTVKPGPTVTTTDGVAGALNTRAKLPYALTDAHGKKQPTFQTFDNGVAVLPRINADGTITVTLSVVKSDVAGPPTAPDGPSPITSQKLSTIRTFASGQTKNIGAFDITAHSARIVFATVTVVSPAKP